jgi:4-hydroxybenzoate polyprenyltransferase
MKTLIYILLSMRPGQWTKNLVVFAALIFSRSFTDGALVLKSIEAFAVLCLLSGTIYLINDIADIEKDRLHEKKRERPLPSGRLGKPQAMAAAGVGMALGVYSAFRIGPEFLLAVCAFIALNLLYSFVLKRVVLLDVLSISLSFILRAISGVEALRSIDKSIEISSWLLICTLFLSLFLAFCKRRHELLTMDGAGEHRAVLSDYSAELLDQLVAMTASGSVIAYAIYTIWPDTVQKFGTTNLVYTVPIVLIGVMRYQYLVFTKQKGGDPSDVLLREKFILITVLAWILLVVAILWLF